MFSRLHGKLGTAGLVVAIVALVAALTGAAFAAGGLTKQQEKQVKKIAKKYAGKRGPAGPQGPAGAPGPKGDAGAKGADGAKGATGDRGPEGPGGPEGPEGSPWTAGGVLPTGETETGGWAYGSSEGLIITAISFNIPLAEAPEAEIVPAPPPGGPTASTAHCPGTAAEPTAAPGFLCIYVQEGTAPDGVEPQIWGAALIKFNGSGSPVVGFGSFAVTAE